MITCFRDRRKRERKKEAEREEQDEEEGGEKRRRIRRREGEGEEEKGDFVISLKSDELSEFFGGSSKVIGDLLGGSSKAKTIKCRVAKWQIGRKGSQYRLDAHRRFISSVADP